MPNKKSNPNELIVLGDTIGKRNEEDSIQALLLQDVFSDSANLEGMQQKTSAQSDTGKGKEAQLDRKKAENRGQITWELGTSYRLIRDGQ